ncbi:DNA polymerase III subunit alpha [Thermaurantimonas aggregans]|uniref:DNA polymerase III subunit alpha n=1 Tax=Thermaurantimonas aggregans TaxID=2173829 RepID=UPI0023F42C7B|nr:DNA polymerase III subunit alpha [Thermaurantimonas aggregans]MCX8149631.1 DNA polymerase III subunit alpha [Thermaurantimonas aggregans]
MKATPVAMSWYSLRYGVIPDNWWIEYAVEQGFRRLVVADINSTSAVFDMMRRGQKVGVQVIPAIDVRQGVERRFTLVAQTWAGFAAINEWLTGYLHSGEPIPMRAPALEGVFAVYPLRRDWFFSPESHEYIGIRPHDLSLLSASPWRYHAQRLIAWPVMAFRHKRDYNAHRLLRAVDLNCLLSKLSPDQQASPEERVLTADELRHAYDQQPQLVSQQERLMDSCCFHYTFGQMQNKRVFGTSAEDDWQLLQQLAEEGLSRRYGSETPELRARLQKEYDIIVQKGFVSYYLIAWDVVRYAAHRGFFHVGRGSGANSLVAYCMGITDVDPVELDLYFERFINLYRENPPDFDLDFSWRDRDEVLAYLFERHGRRHTALLAAVNTFQYRAVVRELGKVFGLPKPEIDRLAEGDLSAHNLDDISRIILRYAQYLHDYPNHLTIHAGGILISDKPMSWYTPTFVPPKGLPTTMFDMYIAEDVGLYKFDILSQRGLGHIRDAVELVRENRGETIDIHDIPRFKADPAISRMLSEGRTMGAFYVESPAMRQLLKKMGCTDYISLVAASSIIRPGVARSGMMREYIRRYRFPEARKDAHPILYDIMPETFGVMVYQEDVIKVAHYYAGLTLAEADVLRRGMSGKYRSREEFERVKSRFFENCRQRGYPDDEAAEIWRQIESFAGYSFAKGHSASFAVESYQSLYLRAHYPLEFMCAVINNFGGFYTTEMYIHEARMLGADVQPPCVNHSRELTCITGRTLWLGLGLIKSLEAPLMERLLNERETNGPYTGLENFYRRVRPGLEQLKILIKAGAFRFTGLDKKELYWQAHWLLSGEKPKSTQPELFSEPTVDFTLPHLETDPIEEAYDQMELLGFPLCSPFDLAVGLPADLLRSRDLPDFVGREVDFYGYLVTIKPTRTVKGERMYFGTWIDVDGHWADSVHFPQVALQYPFRGKGVYHLRGRVCEEYGVYSIEVSYMEKLGIRSKIEV